MKNATQACLRVLSVVIVVGALPTLTGCHRRKHFEADVRIERMRVVRKDEQGNPVATDVEIDYDGCPGDQDEVLRGGKEFSACMTKHKIGDVVKVKIDHVWDADGHYRWNVVEVGGCKRTIDTEDEASYAMIRECEDWVVNDAKVGFQCNIAPQRKLLKQCPWFARH